MSSVRRSAITRRGFAHWLAAGALTGTLSPLARAADLTDIQTSGRLRCAVYRDNAPWSWREGGRLTGIDVDIAALVAGDLGLDLELMEFGADESVDDDLRNVVWKGAPLGPAPADIMLHAPVEAAFAARNDKTRIGAAYCRETYAFVLDAVAPSDWATALDGRLVGVELDGLPDFYLVNIFSGRWRPNIVHYPSASEAMRALRNGEIAGAMVTKAQAQYGVRDTRGTFRIVDGPFPGLRTHGWNVGVAVRAASNELYAACSRSIEGALQNGALDRLFAAYNVTRSTPI